MMGHGSIGIAALLSSAALGYFVCTKANSEKKGSNLKAVGLALGSLIIIISILGSLCIVVKSGKYPLVNKFRCYKNAITGQGHQAPVVCPKR